MDDSTPDVPQDIETPAKHPRRGRGKALAEQVRRLKEDKAGMERRADELAARIAELEDERLRLLAEMENMRKRSQRRLEDERWGLLAEISRPVLEVADNLERAAHMGEATGAQEATVSGIRMVHSQLLEVLLRWGVAPIDAVGRDFDFNFHEAIAHAPSQGARDNEVLTEVSRGYLLNGRLLRPSKVVVAKGAEQDQAEASP